MKVDGYLAFEHAQVPYGDDGKRVRGIIARCGAPGCERSIPLPVNCSMDMGNRRGTQGEIEWQFIARKLEAKGWRIGKSRTSHRCPECFKKAKFAAINKSKANAIATLNEEIAMQVIAENNTRVMSRDDRRIIFEKLNEVYVDDKVGYGNGWTDEKVASNLGVPRAWVRIIRDENFGDEIANDDIRQRLGEATNALAQIKTIEPEIRRLLVLADKVEKSLAEIARVFK